MASSSLPCFCSLNRPLARQRILKHSQVVKSQIFRDEGKSTNIVDANLSVLRERIEEVRTKQKLENCMVINQGWESTNGYCQDHHFKGKRSNGLKSWAQECVEIIGLASGAIGLVFLCGTICICLVSFTVQLSKVLN